MHDESSRLPSSAGAFEKLLASALVRLDVDGPEALDELCAAHPEHSAQLRARIDELRRLDLIDSPGTRAAPGQPRLPGSLLGDYRLLGRLGAGGMGIVYLARDERLGRVVALKMLHARLQASPRARRRFEREVRAVSRIRHPHIVPVFDVGEWRGVPFYTMEYVPGCTLARVLDRLRASGPDVAELGSDDLRRCARPDASPLATDETPGTSSHWSGRYTEVVCRWTAAIARALGAAHGQGTLHRDVKPSNIIVTPGGDVRLFDFGLAQQQGDASLTMSGDFVGTMYYASPEQAAGRAVAVDERSDVYSLGATLYQLLTLGRPFPGADARSVQRAIESRDPVPPRRLNRSVPRDLETVCLTALEKDPARRYPSAAAMAEDLERFLERRPVAARPIGRAERAWRAVRRDPAPVLFAALVVLVLVAIPVGLTVALIQIDNSRALARSLAVTLEETLLEADVEELGRDAKALDLLLRAADLIPARLADQPRDQARLLMKIGSVCAGLDELERGETLLRSALSLQTRVLGSDHPDVAETHNHLANVCQSTGRLDEAERSYRAAIEIGRATGLSDLVRVATNNLVILLNRQWRLDESDALVRDQLVALARDPQAKFADRLNTMIRFAWIAVIRRDLEAGRERVQDVLALMDAHPEAAPVDRMNVENLAGEVALRSGRHQEALRSFEQQLAHARDHGGDQSLVVGLALQNLGRTHTRLASWEQALDCYRRSQRILDVAYAGYPRHPALATLQVYIGNALALAGEDAAAERELRAGLAAYPEGTVGHESPQATGRKYLALVLLRRDPTSREGIELLTEAAERYEALFGADSPECRDCRERLAAIPGSR